ncbi:MAG: preprotein translocase subunit YajC [Oscillospiraceae bacterium]|nr:preprotein translocase subunit YajC [Oscillospiraceae bacterium]
MNRFLIMMSQSASASSDAAMTGGMSLLTLLLPIGAMVLIFWLMIIRPEKKRTREMQNMLNNLQVADEVVTNGGIIGLVVSVSKDTVLIETGSDRTKIRILKSAIAKNNTEHDTPEEVAAPAKKSSKGKTEIK